MAIDRRSALGLSAGGAAGALLPTPGRASPMPLGSLGLDVTHFGVNPGSPEDQTNALQRAIDASAEARMPLWLPAGVYIAADLLLPSGAQLFGIRGATKLLLGHGASIMASSRADQVTLQGLVFDGREQFIPDGRGLITLRNTRGVRILECYIQASGGAGIALAGVEGEIAHTTVVGALRGGVHASDSRGLTIASNTIFNCAGHGISVTRESAGDDGTQVTGNRIEQIRPGNETRGDGIVANRAANVIVADNRIHACAASALRAFGTTNLHVRGNAASSVGDIAILAEGSIEGALISGNSIDGAAGGISVADRTQSGRLVACHGNLVRNLRGGDPAAGRGIGIAVEADSAITGNVVEGAPFAGIIAGFGKSLRDVTVTGNMVRTAPIGIGVSASPAVGSALVAHNLIAGATAGAVIGMEDGRPVTGDLAREEANRFAHITVSGNRVR